MNKNRDFLCWWGLFAIRRSRKAGGGGGGVLPFLPLTLICPISSLITRDR